MQKELGCSKAAGLQTGTGRASSANSPALGSGKGRRRINHSPQLMLWKPHTLLRGSRSAHKGWRGARNDLSPAQEQLQEVLGPTSTTNPLPKWHWAWEPLGYTGPQTVPWAGGSMLVSSRPNKTRNGSKNWMSELLFVGSSSPSPALQPSPADRTGHPQRGCPEPCSCPRGVRQHQAGRVWQWGGRHPGGSQTKPPPSPPPGKTQPSHSHLPKIFGICLSVPMRDKNKCRNLGLSLLIIPPYHCIAAALFARRL